MMVKMIIPDITRFAIQVNTSYELELESILDQCKRWLLNKATCIVKVWWMASDNFDATWELKDEIWCYFPHLFEYEVWFYFWGQKYPRRGACNTPNIWILLIPCNLSIVALVPGQSYDNMMLYIHISKIVMKMIINSAQSVV